jgi:chromosome segregation ATPase
MTPFAHSTASAPRASSGNAAPSVPTRYEILLPDGSVEGPLASSGVRALASDGAIDSRAQIRRIGDATWRPITSVAGLVVRVFDSHAEAEAIAQAAAIAEAARAEAAQAEAERTRAERAEAERAEAERAHAAAEAIARADAERERSAAHARARAAIEEAQREAQAAVARARTDAQSQIEQIHAQAHSAVEAAQRDAEASVIQARSDAAAATARAERDAQAAIGEARERAERSLREAEAAITSAQHQAREEVRRARLDAREEIETALARARQEIDRERDALESRATDLQLQLSTVRDEAAALQKILASERDAFVATLRQSQDQLESARAVQRDLSQEVEHARERASQEANSRAVAESARDQALADLEQAAREAQLRDADAQDRINRVQLLLDEAQGEMARERADSERRIHDVMRRLQESAAHAKALEDARTAAEGQWMQACAERDEAIRDRDATRIAIGATQTELVQMRTQLDATRQELASIRSARAELTARIADLEPALDAQRARTASVESALARAEDANAALTETSNELRARIAKLDAQLLQAHLEAERMAAEFEEARQHAARELAAQERSAAEAIASTEAQAAAHLATAVEEERRVAAERLDTATSAHARELATIHGQLDEERQRVVARDELIFRESLRAEERDREIRALQDTLREERTQALAARDRLAADHAAAVGALRLELESTQQRASALEHESARLASALRAEQESHASEVVALQRQLAEETDALRASVDRESALREHAEAGARAVLASYEKLSDESGRRIADLEVRLASTSREFTDAVAREQSLQKTLEEASGRMRSQTQRIGELESERAAAAKDREQIEAKLVAETAARKKAEGAIAAATQRAERIDRDAKATLARAVQAASAALAGIRQRIEEDVERSRVEIDALDGLVRAASSQLIAAGGTVPGLPQLPRDAASATVVRLIEEQRAAEAKRIADAHAALEAQRAIDAARDADAQRAASTPSGPPRLGPASPSGPAGTSPTSPRDAIDARARGVPFKLVDDDVDTEAAAAGSLRARATPRAPRSTARGAGDPGGSDGDGHDGAGAAVQPVENQAAAHASTTDANSPWDQGDADDGPRSRERCDNPAKVILAVAAAAGASAILASLPALRAAEFAVALAAIAAWTGVAAIAMVAVVAVSKRCSARLALRIPALAGASIALAPAGALFAPLTSAPALLGWIAASGGVWFLPWALAWAAWPASDRSDHVGPSDDPFRGRRRLALGASALAMVLGAVAAVACAALGTEGTSWSLAPWSASPTWIALGLWAALPALALAWRLTPRRVAAARAADARIDPVVLARHERAAASASAALSSVIPLVPAMAAWLVARTRSRRGEAQMRSIVEFEWWSLAAMLTAAVGAVLGLGWWPFAAVMIAHACAMAFTAASLVADRVMRLPVPAALLSPPAGGLSLPRPVISVKRAAQVTPSRPIVHPCATSWALGVHAALVVALGLPLVLSPAEPISVPSAMRIISLLALAGAASWIPGWIAARLRHADAIAISGTGLLAALAAVSVTCIAGPGSVIAQAALWSATLTWGALLAWASSALRLSADDAARLTLAIDRAESGDMSAWHTLDDPSHVDAVALEPGEAAPPPPESLVSLAIRATSARVVAAASASAACIAGLVGAAPHVNAWSAAPVHLTLAWSAAAACALATLCALALPLARPRRGAATAALALSASGAALWIAQILVGVHASGIAGAGHGIWMLVTAATLSMVAASVSWTGTTVSRAGAVAFSHPKPAADRAPSFRVPMTQAALTPTVLASSSADVEPPTPRRQPKSVVRKPSAKVTTGS